MKANSHKSICRSMAEAWGLGVHWSWHSPQFQRPPFWCRHSRTPSVHPPLTVGDMPHLNTAILSPIWLDQTETCPPVIGLSHIHKVRHNAVVHVARSQQADISSKLTTNVIISICLQHHRRTHGDKMELLLSDSQEVINSLTYHNPRRVRWITPRGRYGAALRVQQKTDAQQCLK